MRREVACLLVLTILLALATVPDVRAQTTSITNLQVPSRALVGRGVHIKFTVSYSLGSSGAAVGIGIADVDTTYETWVAGSAYASSPNVCMQGTSIAVNSAYCSFAPSPNTSGSVNVDFIFTPQTPRTYHLESGAFLFDSSDNQIAESISRQSFSIIVSYSFELDVITQPSIVMTVDGTNQSSGSVYLQLNPGSHTLSVPSIVEVSSGERLRFDHWSDGFTSTNRTVDLQNDTNYTVTYLTQYKLTLLTPEGDATGEGWYNEGSMANFSVPSSVPMDGILGMLGGQFDFQQWQEKGEIMTSSNSSLIMNTQHTLMASWTPNYIMPITILGIVIVAIVVLAAFLIRKKSGSRKRRRTTPKRDKTMMFCDECGAKIPRNSTFCERCGTKLA